MYRGSDRIQRSNYEVVQDEADEFAMKEDEEPRELFRRVTKLAVALRDHGSKDTDDNWIKHKFLKAMMPYNKAMSSIIRQRPDFHSMTSGEVLDEFVAMNILDKTADNAVLRSQRAKKPNLALKAKVSVEEEKEEEDEESNPEDTKQSQVLPNKNNFTKKTPSRGLVVQEEYREDDDDDEDGETMAMASVAIVSTPRVSLFDAPNENITAKCLMAKATNKVTPNIKTTIIPNPPSTDDFDNGKGSNEDINEFESFMSKLKGKSKKHFVALLEQLGEANDMIEAHEETITKMESHSRDYADEISDLSNALEEECEHRLALEESHNDGHAKLKKDLDHALAVSRVLASEKAKLGVDHVRLTEEFDVLDKAHKVLKGAHATLKESHAQLQILTIRSDNGTEFKNYTLDEFLSDEGIKHQYSAPYTPQQNGVAERKNRTLMDAARTMMAEFKSPYKFWAEAINTACHASNRLYLRKGLNKTPYEILTGNKPNLKYFRVFGCKCFILKKGVRLSKFEARAHEGIFVGYATNSHAYSVLNKSNGLIEETCNVEFDENNGSQVEQSGTCDEKDNAPLKWSHHLPKTHTLPKNKVKALTFMNKTKDKINLKMEVNLQMMPKVKFSPSSKFKIMSKLKMALKMIKLTFLLPQPRKN
ncbi:hypothetical protein VPH35_113499 [Triticum aestivum]